MDFLNAFWANKILVCAIISWFVAQVIKIGICFFDNRRISLSLLIASGGMPSSHSSTVTALCVMIGRIYTISSVEFAIAAVFGFIVMYDAAGVRRSAGEQAKVINRIVADNPEGDYMDKDLKELIGHTPLQVLIGAILGFAIAMVFPIA